MACDGAYSTADEYAAFWCIGDLPLSADETTTIEMYLDTAAGGIQASLAASGQCSCTLSSWGANYLSQLNIISAAIFHRCPCGRPELTDEQKTAFLFWINEQLTMIRETKIDVCLNATGADFPALGWGKQALTPWAQAQTYLNYLAMLE